MKMTTMTNINLKKLKVKIMSETKLGVALVKEACPICGKLQDGPIVMNTILSEYRAKQVEEMNGKTIGYSKEPCDECKDLMSKGFLVIGYVESKTDFDEKPINFYRSGNQWVIKPESAVRMFGEEHCQKGVLFLSVEAADKMGFPECNLNA